MIHAGVFFEACQNVLDTLEKTDVLDGFPEQNITETRLDALNRTESIIVP